MRDDPRLLGGALRCQLRARTEGDVLALSNISAGFRGSAWVLKLRSTWAACRSRTARTTKDLITDRFFKNKIERQSRASSSTTIGTQK